MEHPQPHLPDSMYRNIDFEFKMSCAEANGLAAVIDLGMQIISLLKRSPRLTNLFPDPVDIEGVVALLGASKIKPIFVETFLDALITDEVVLPEDYFKEYFEWSMARADEWAEQTKAQKHKIGSMEEMLNELARRIQGDVSPEEDVGIAVFQLGGEDTPEREPSPTE